MELEPGIAVSHPAHGCTILDTVLALGDQGQAEGRDAVPGRLEREDDGQRQCRILSN